MDCNMPFMDGPTASHHIRQFVQSKIQLQQQIEYNPRRSLASKQWRQPMIFAVTGHTEESYTTHAIEMGMD